MATPKTTVWDIEPHTKAKHEMLSFYLDAWFPILSSWNERVLFIDGFAGPGHYTGGEPGSPHYAVESAKRREAMLKGTTVMFLFNEADEQRHAELEKWVERTEKDAPDSFQLYHDNQEFVDLAQGLVDDRGDKQLVPTFAFVDPFGWKGVPIDLISDLVRDKRSELFILFSFNSINRWITHEQQQENMRALFGCYDFLDADGLPPPQRKTFLADLYESQLRSIGKFPYVSRFEMIERKGRTSYFLYHCTRSLKGLEVMRSAMWKIDPQRGCQFSDRVAGIAPLFTGPIVFDLDQRLLDKFRGDLVPIRTLQEFVLTDTPYAPKHLKKETLKPMQQAGLIEVPGQRRRFTYPDGSEIYFVP